MTNEFSASPSERANAERWSADDEAWRGYRTRSGKLELEDRVDQARRLMVPSPGGQMLDVGCATGVVSRVLADAAGVASVQGLDFADVKGQVPTTVHNLDSRTPFPFPDASFDVVTCLETLEHVHETDYLLQQIHRVLRPTGYAVISVPRLDGFLNLLMLAAGAQPPGVDCSMVKRYGAPEAGTRVSGHVSHFTRRAFEEIVREQGFRIESYRQAGIYKGWLFANEGRAALWKRLPLWALSKLPVKSDVQLVRVRPA